MFGFHDNQMEGSVDGDGFMEYTVLGGTTEELLTALEEEVEVEDIVYEDSGVQSYYEQSIYDGMTVTDKSYSVVNAGEGFEATGVTNNGYPITTICYKFESTDDAIDFVYTYGIDNDYEISDDGSGVSIDLVDAENDYLISFTIYPDGLLVGIGL